MEKELHQLDTLMNLPYTTVKADDKHRTVVYMEDIVKAMKPLKEALAEQGLVYFGGKLIKTKKS